ncbi:transcriptional regulator GlcC [soil metagenome]
MSVEAASLSQSDVVVVGIKKMIVDGELRAGDRLPVEKDLAIALGVSRGSLREGVRALSMMGVLTTKQGAGTYVTGLDPSLLMASMGFLVDLQDSAGLRQVHSVRRVLETEAVGHAALRIDEAALTQAGEILDLSELAMRSSPVDHDAVLDCDLRFHRLIADASGNGVLSGLIEALAGKTLRTRLRRALSDEQADRIALSEHRDILRSLRLRDPDGARVRMASHLLGVEDFAEDHPAEAQR